MKQTTPFPLVCISTAMGSLSLSSIWAIESHAEPAPVRPLQDHLYFATDDLDATLDRAVEAGAEITSPIEVMPWGERSFYCTDPDSHPLCFVDRSTLFLGRGAAWA